MDTAHPSDNHILALLLDPNRSIIDLAAELQLTLLELLDRLKAPALREAIEQAVAFARTRAKLYAAAMLPRALATLAEIACDPATPLEPRRKAARQLTLSAAKLSGENPPPGATCGEAPPRSHATDERRQAQTPRPAPHPDLHPRPTTPAASLRAAAGAPGPPR